MNQLIPFRLNIFLYKARRTFNAEAVVKNNYILNIMKTNCPKCHLKNYIEFEGKDVSGKGKTLFCRKCQFSFLISEDKRDMNNSLINDIKNKLDSLDKIIIDEKNPEIMELAQNNRPNREDLKEEEEALPNAKDAESCDQSKQEENQEPLSNVSDIIEQKPSPQPPSQQPQARSETKEDSKTEGEEDIDRMFEEVESELLDDQPQDAPEDPFQGPSEPELIREPDEDIDRMFKEAVSELLNETLQNTTETPVQDKAEPKSTKEPGKFIEAKNASSLEPTQQPSSSTEAENYHDSEGLKDIYAMFEEALSEPLDVASQYAAEKPIQDPSEPEETKGPEESIEANNVTPQESIQELTPQQSSPSETKGEAGTQERKDVYEMFEQAVKQQLEGTLKDDSPQNAKIADAENNSTLFEQEDNARDISKDSAEIDSDLRQDSALKESESITPESSGNLDQEQPDEPYSIQSGQFMEDLENLLQEANEDNEESKVNLEESNKNAEELLNKTVAFSAAVLAKNDDSSVSNMAEENQTKSEHEEKELFDQESGDRNFAQPDQMETLQERNVEGELPEEEIPTNDGQLQKNRNEHFGERFLFFRSRKNPVEILVSACMILLVLSLGSFWFFKKSRSNDVTSLEATDEAKFKIYEEMARSRPAITGGQEERPIERKKEVQNGIPGIVLSDSDEKNMSINIGSIVPLTFSPDETKILSLNIKLFMDNQNAYDQVKKGFSTFENKVENIIEKYFEGKFYNEIPSAQEKLSQELREKINQEIVRGKIKKVTLEDFLIQ